MERKGVRRWKKRETETDTVEKRKRQECRERQRVKHFGK